MKTIILIILCAVLNIKVYADGNPYWLVKLNDSTLFDSRKISTQAFSIDSYVLFNFYIHKNDIKISDTLTITWFDGEIYIDEMYNFFITEKYECSDGDGIASKGNVLYPEKVLTGPVYKIPLKTLLEKTKKNIINCVYFYREGESFAKELCRIWIE